LLSQGHVAAARYPLWQVWQEAEIVADREGLRLANTAVALQAASSSVWAGKEGQAAFRDFVESLTHGQ
jgi:hypothetical protein